MYTHTFPSLTEDRRMIINHWIYQNVTGIDKYISSSLIIFSGLLWTMHWGMLHSLSAETLMIVVQSKSGFFDGMNGSLSFAMWIRYAESSLDDALKGSYHDKSNSLDILHVIYLCIHNCPLVLYPVHTIVHLYIVIPYLLYLTNSSYV